ncbi:MAG: ribonuclease HI, partial [Bacteriovorax sp.]|nr:ribonuclease HI [Bacteriovorax sp.]
MRKIEILRNLKKLLGIYDGDKEAQDAIELLLKKAELFQEDRSHKAGAEESFALPEQLRELSSGFAIFADGACRGNPGPGAWATLIQDTKAEIILKSSGVDVPTTNNKMELEGVIRGLKGLVEKWIEEGFSDHESPVFIFSDSKYVIDGIEKWVPGWKSRGWKKADQKAPENLVLWQELDELKERFNHITFLWVKGHAGQ